VTVGKPPYDEDEHPFGIRVHWNKTDDGEFPYAANVDGHAWGIRVNDWPEDPTVYTLLVDGEVYLDFDGWGDDWNKPL